MGCGLAHLYIRALPTCYMGAPAPHSEASIASHARDRRSGHGVHILELAVVISRQEGGASQIARKMGTRYAYMYAEAIGPRLTDGHWVIRFDRVKLADVDGRRPPKPSQRIAPYRSNAR